MDDRIVDNNLIDHYEVEEELSLRPERLSQYIGQHKIKENLDVLFKLQSSEMKRLIMYYSTDLQD